MKYLVQSVMIMTLSLSLISCSNGQTGSVTNIDHAELKEILSNQEVHLVDIRTNPEVERGMIEGAIQIDYYDKEFFNKVNGLDKDKPLVLYCAVGGRSARAASQLRDMGFSKIYDVSGGYNAWKAAGFPIASPQ